MGRVETSWAPAAPPLAERRLGSLLKAAREFGTSVPLGDLTELLPTESPENSAEMHAWLTSRPDLGRVHGGRVYDAGAHVGMDLDDRHARGDRFWVSANRFWSEAMAPVHPLVQSVGVTGSTAFGEPEAGDDIDLLTITRTGSMWVFLTFAFLTARRRRPGLLPRDAAGWCFNYVLDDREARREFARARGFMFAREALMTRPVAGVEYYRGLVGTATWLRDEVPRLFQRWERNGFPSPPVDRPASLPVRLVNALLFPVLAAYLQAVGLVRNHRFRRSGHPERAFTTVTSLRRLTFESARYAQLTRLLAPGTAVARPEGAG